jgi:hypothetical protein
MNLQNRPILKIGAIIVSFAIIIAGGMIGGTYLLSKRPTYIQMNTGTDGKPVNNISVTATGKVSVTPDLVTFEATYNNKKSDIKSVQEDLTRNNNQIIQALKDKGVADKDIQTKDFSITPSYRWEYSSNKRLDDGQTGRSVIFVKVRNKEKAGEIMDATVNAGANQLSNITFTIDDLEKPRSDARKLATDGARKKANELASGSGVSVGGLISISETSYSYAPTQYSNSYNDLTAGKAIDTTQVTTLASGSLEVTISVNATYAIEN